MRDKVEIIDVKQVPKTEFVLLSKKKRAPIQAYRGIPVS